MRTSDAATNPNGSPVAAVFVATNEREFLIAALGSLFEHPPSNLAEVVVVDNASTDGTADEVARLWPSVRLVHQPVRRGLSANLNMGIRATGSPLIMACNCDILFRPGSIDRLVDVMEAVPSAGMAAPRLVSADGRVWPSARRWYSLASLIGRRLPTAIPTPRCVRRHLYAEENHLAPRPVDWVLCAATLLRRSAVSDVGGLDERFRLYFLDVDLAFGMHEAGWQVWTVPNAEVVHHWQRASRRFMSAAWRSHLYSLLQFYAKHRSFRPRVTAEVAPTSRGIDRADSRVPVAPAHEVDGGKAPKP